jgi:hypothetical protein
MPNVKVLMEAEHFIPTLSLHDLLRKDIRFPYCRMLHLFLYTRQDLGLRLSSVPIKVRSKMFLI